MYFLLKIGIFHCYVRLLEGPRDLLSSKRPESPSKLQVLLGPPTFLEEF